MEDSPPPASAAYAVSRSRGKRPGESLYNAKLRAMRKAKEHARSSDESESEDEIEPGEFVRGDAPQMGSFVQLNGSLVGAVILHKMFRRKVVLHPDNTVVKSGLRIALGEAEALRVAVRAGIPAPSVHDVQATSDGQGRIRMDYIQGQSLDKLWPDMSAEKRKDMARQLREIVVTMRSVAPPPNLIGACDGTEIRDTRLYNTYHSPPCRDEAAFNDFLLSGLYESVPPLLREAFSRRLRTNHRVVLSHCDLAPRNILVQEGKIKGLVDWEDSGWYPEYWEYVKFFQRAADKEWKEYAEDIFPELYHDELVDFVAISKWQNA
ncbi:phosphotransferase [Colletotrichum higginsianum]|uniref:Phosphotransferase n=1 Tax=Colletotrichum higginsianum (strain IMI 349063) TaxID=759273 RepID=H1VEM9_COLHI|nr:Phosphotransferase [Colletotrichum higginsianum IMI 349063]OBR15686.1 Phosphotransferase [Colletotrichum higginsianum IMI 349063]CCF38682.1 phosphotransferase [Colletotrichum higginsianum]